MRELLELLASRRMDSRVLTAVTADYDRQTTLDEVLGGFELPAQRSQAQRKTGAASFKNNGICTDTNFPFDVCRHGRGAYDWVPGLGQGRGRQDSLRGSGAGGDLLNLTICEGVLLGIG
jgi:hypothetical protein